MTEGRIEPCTTEDEPAILAIVNRAAERYRGAIPDDCFHDPYMSEEALRRERQAGVAFSGIRDGGALLGVMGIQPVADVVLIRHAYVAPQAQGRGIGSRLLDHLVSSTDKPVLIGTWAAASWAIGFYRRHGFETAPPEEARALLRLYWTISDRQAEMSVVLRRP
jgi:GNAT superfamily N-acetyltransferase